MAARNDPPRLAPGVRVVARGRDRVQAGITLGREVTVAQGSAEAAVLDRLRRGWSLTQAHRALPVVAALEAAALLAHARRSPDAKVLVLGAFGADGEVARALATAGLRPVSVRRAGRSPGLFLACGEPEREEFDPWLREGRPHLVVRLVDGLVVLGPFVEPGRTACLRCLDAHRHDADPEHIPVLHRYIHEERADGHTDEVPSADAALALAWAARDLATWHAGGRPATLSTTITLEPGGLTATAWLRHPECVCGWGVHAPVADPAHLTHE
jgi:bacteriocin biosynthesis cyclodehydratase domain-containing protein